MKVLTRIVGSTCVVLARTPSPTAAIVAHRSRTGEHIALLNAENEVVQRLDVPLEAAPRTIVAIMRNGFKPLEGVHQ